MNHPSQPTIALLHWGDLIEDFLDSIGTSFKSFCSEMTGGWMFGYIAALRLVGVQTVLFCISDQVQHPTYYTHTPTGAKICLLPAPALHRSARRRMQEPYGRTLEEVFLEEVVNQKPQSLRKPFLAGLRDITPYVATPIRMLGDELRREGCQAILCQEYEYARFDACVLLGQLIRVPVFATFQGGELQPSHLERMVRPLAMRACAGLIVATQTEMHRVKERYALPSEKLCQIFNPMDVSNWRAVNRQEARLALDIPIAAQVVIYHGRIEIHRKGLDVLLEAWAQICRDRPNPNLQLLLVGTGSDAEKFRQLLSKKQLPGITWIDEYVRDRRLLWQYLSAADVYVLPSRHEGFPVAPLEAMACGLPIVAADAPGVPDILEQGELSGGLMVPREDPMAIATALSRILENPSLAQELGQRARQRIEDSFSLETIGDQLRDFLLKPKQRV